METLYKGVMDSLGYISGGDIKSHNQRVFYVHDADTSIIEDNELILEVSENQCSAQPEINDFIILKKRHFRYQKSPE